MTFYFFDLETSGFSPRTDRVMQFAGQRTDKNLEPIGEADNLLIKLTPDILPQPEAVLVTGLTPQQTITEGVSESDFLEYFFEHVSTPDTVMVGFNNIRFDNEFMRFMLWRNFYDAYEWSWKNGCSTWDLLDVVRMTRALRPEGIKWPFASDGKPSNKLELLASVNKLEHANAHDALSDVMALVDLAKLVRAKQPRLFDYLLNMRAKDKVAALVNTGNPFIYTSGRYPSEYEKTAVVVKIADHPGRPAALVYDLRINPDKFSGLPPEKLAELMNDWSREAEYFPVKTLIYNRCPAVAPLSVLDQTSCKRLQHEPELAQKNLAKLMAADDFGDKLIRAIELSKKADQVEGIADPQKVDGQLYDGFINDSDKSKMSALRATEPANLSGLHLDFSDERLNILLPLYKARNYPKLLDVDEVMAWEKFRHQKLLNGGDKSQLSSYFAKLNELASKPEISQQQRYLLEELNLYGQSISPID